MPKEYQRVFKTNSVDAWTRDVILSEDFENGVAAWPQFFVGTGSVEVDNAFVFKGTNSVKLTTGAALNNNAEMLKALPPVDKELMEFVFTFSPGAQGNEQLEIFLSLQAKVSPRQYSLGVRLKETTASIWDISIRQAGDWLEVASNKSYNLSDDFVSVRLVFNLRTEKYVSLEVGRLFLDISAEGFSAGDASQSSIDPQRLDIILKTLEAAVKTMNLDRIFLASVIEPPVNS